MSYLTRQLTTQEMVDMAVITDILSTESMHFSKGGPLYHGDVDRPSPWAELTKFVDESTDRYHSAVLGGVTVNVGYLAGRVLITLLRGDRTVSLLGGAGEVASGCGIHSISASAGEAREMIQSVIKNWDLKAFAAAPNLSIV